MPYFILKQAATPQAQSLERIPYTGEHSGVCTAIISPLKADCSADLAELDVSWKEIRF